MSSSKTFKKKLRALLVADEGIKEVVGDRVYQGLAPQGLDSKSTYIVFASITGLETVTDHSEPTKLRTVRLQFDIHSPSFSSTEDVSDALTEAMSKIAGYRGDGVKIGVVIYSNDIDLVDPLKHTFRKVIDFRVQYYTGPEF